MRSSHPSRALGLCAGLSLLTPLIGAGQAMATPAWAPRLGWSGGVPGRPRPPLTPAGGSPPRGSEPSGPALQQ
ncbi:MAG: hypothetical protein ACK4ZO_00055, partial [Cyanobacteriota bacterium]